jgi:hypothetical protein
MQVNINGAWLVDAVQGNGQVIVDATPLNTNGTPSGAAQTVPYNVNSASVSQMAISSDDNYVFVASGTGGTLLLSFTAGSSSTPLPPATQGTIIDVANTGGSAFSVAVDPSLRLFYIGESLASGGTTGGLRVFNYSSLGGTLTQATGSPIATGGLAPYAVLPIASGDYVYVANGTGPSSAGNVTGFSITSTNGAYTVAKNSSVSTGILPYGLAEDSTTNFVLAVCEGGSPDLEAYIFDTTTAGQLDATITSNNSTNPGSVGIAATAP